MAKPILIVRKNDTDFETFKELIVKLKSELDDYHVIGIHNDNFNLHFQILDPLQNG